MSLLHFFPLYLFLAATFATSSVQAHTVKRYIEMDAIAMPPNDV